MTGKFVLDASATLGWLFNGSAASRIKSVLDRNDAIAPWLWQLEVTNSVLVHERRKKCSPAQAAYLLQMLDQFAIELMPEPATRTPTALAGLARPYQLSAYDAVYLDLAMRRGLPLLTLDNNLTAAARRVGVELIKF